VTCLYVAFRLVWLISSHLFILCSQCYLCQHFIILPAIFDLWLSYQFCSLLSAIFTIHVKYFIKTSCHLHSDMCLLIIYICVSIFYCGLHFTVCGPFFCGSYFMLSQSFTCVSHFMLSQSFSSCMSIFKLFDNHFMLSQSFTCCVLAILFLCQLFSCCDSHSVFSQSFYLFYLRHFICACHFRLFQPCNKSPFYFIL
jgi:hypothetical protein